MESLPEPPCSLILPTNSQSLSVLVAGIRSQKGDRNCGKPSLLSFSFLCLNVGPSLLSLNFIFPLIMSHDALSFFCCMLRTVLLKEFRSGKPNPKQNRKLDTMGTLIPNIIVLSSPCLLLPHHFATLVRNQDWLSVQWPSNTHDYDFVRDFRKASLYWNVCITAHEWKANSVTFWTLC